jgi:hypothetical protein
MPEEYTFLLNKSYSRESRTDFPGKREWQNCWDPGKSGTGNPGNEALDTPTSVVGFLSHFLHFCFGVSHCVTLCHIMSKCDTQ